MTPEERLVELEIRYTHQQDTIEQLSDIVAGQGRLLDALRAELDLLRRQVVEGPKETPPADDPPPHY